MKSSLTADALSASLSVCPRNIGSVQSDQSYFSLLLAIETRMRAEARRDSLPQANRRRLARRKNHKRPGVENLSRYIELPSTFTLRIDPDTSLTLEGVPIYDS